MYAGVPSTQFHTGALNGISVALLAGQRNNSSMGKSVDWMRKTSSLEIRTHRPSTHVMQRSSLLDWCATERDDWTESILLPKFRSRI